MKQTNLFPHAYNTKFQPSLRMQLRAYLSDLLHLYTCTESRQLCSSNKSQTIISPHVCTKAYDERSFSFVAPSVWYDLPFSPLSSPFVIQYFIIETCSFRHSGFHRSDVFWKLTSSTCHSEAWLPSTTFSSGAVICVCVCVCVCECMCACVCACMRFSVCSCSLLYYLSFLLDFFHVVFLSFSFCVCGLLVVCFIVCKLLSSFVSSNVWTFN